MTTFDAIKNTTERRYKITRQEIVELFCKPVYRQLKQLLPGGSMKPQSKIQRFLFVIEDGLSPVVIGGPYQSEADLTAGIIRAINKDPGLARLEGDTIHALTLSRGRPRMRNFTGGFMDQLRQLARGKTPDNPVWLIYKGAEVIAGNGKDHGTMTGGALNCRQVESCPGLQVAVRWPNGGLTWPCTRGMMVLPSGRWKIHNTT